MVVIDLVPRAMLISQWGLIATGIMIILGVVSFVVSFIRLDEDWWLPSARATLWVGGLLLFAFLLFFTYQSASSLDERQTMALEENPKLELSGVVIGSDDTFTARGPNGEFIRGMLIPMGHDRFEVVYFSVPD